MSKKTTTILALMIAFITAPISAGDVVTLTSDRDNTLYEDEVGGTSNGAGIHFFAGRTLAGALRRGLIHFDLSSIPPGSTIESAILTLNMSMTIVGSEPISLHPATADWGEGASDAPGQEGAGAPAENGDATWLHTSFPTDFWTNAGGDFSPVPSATTMVGGNGSYDWGTTAAMEADVQQWLDNPSQNFGWVVVGNEQDVGQQGGPTTKRFDTREIDQDGVLGPQLEITFLPPVPVELQSLEVD